MISDMNFDQNMRFYLKVLYYCCPIYDNIYVSKHAKYLNWAIFKKATDRI